MNKFEGLVAAPYVPLHKDGQPNLDLIGAYYNLLKKNGVVGAFINGSTGEGVSLSQKEKLRVVEKWTQAYKQDNTVRIINLVGGTSYQECIDGAIFSFEHGVSAIALIAPFYFKPSSVGHLAEFCTLVAESVPNLPVYLYHIPVLTGVNLPMIDFLRTIIKMAPNFAGIKFTHEDFMDYQSCLNFENGRYDIIWGRDECLLSALVLGACGSIGSTYNYAAPLYHNLMRAYNEGDIIEARRFQQMSIDMIKLLGKYGGIATGKAFMRYIGLDCGKFRSPVQNMTEDMYQSFKIDIQSLKMDNMFSSQ